VRKSPAILTSRTRRVRLPNGLQRTPWGSPVVSRVGGTIGVMVATLYDGGHKALRKRRVAAYRPGDPCAIGGEPLSVPARFLDLAHDDVNGGYLPGLSCQYHNRSHRRPRGPLPWPQRRAIAWRTGYWR
jgi:hypothetical protein